MKKKVFTFFLYPYQLLFETNINYIIDFLKNYTPNWELKSIEYILLIGYK